jgi:DNA-binding NarL/FixJ family response regulator
MATNPLTRVRRAAERAAAAASERDEAIVDAHKAGLTLKAIAAEAGLSFQRVHQIVRR